MSIAEPYLSLYYTGTSAELRLDSGTDDMRIQTLRVGVASLNPSWHSHERYSLAEMDMTIRVNAATMTEVWTAYTALAAYAKYAEAWRRGVTEYNVMVRYKANGSVLSVSYAEALAETIEIDEPDGMGWVNDTKTLYDLHVRIWRRGLWLGDTETPTATSSGDMPVVKSLTFASAPANPGVCDLEFATTLDSLNNIPQSGWLLVAPSTSYLEVNQCNGMTTTAWTSVADTAAKAWGNILRYTPTVTAEAWSGSLTLTNTYTPTVHLYAAVRNNSAKNWRVRVRGIHIAGVTGWVYSSPLTIASTDAANPTIYYIGSITALRGIKYIQFGVTLLGASVSGSLDFDYVAALAQLPNSYAMQHDAESMTGATYSYTGVAANALGRAPYWFYRDTAPAPDIDVAFSGQAQRVYMAGGNLAALYMATSSTYWRLVDSGGTVRQIYLDGTRRLGHVVPQ